jgi:Uma2 family endonuclease
MVAAVRPAFNEEANWAGLLEPDLLVNGAKPEQRVVYSGLSWERYLAIDKERSKDRSFPRFYYLDGDLEIMSTSEEHERLKMWIGDLIGDFFFESEMDVVPRGEATMRLELKKAGAEPDQSWCLDRARKFPDLVVEIALSSGGIPKLDVYQRFKIPEVWIWRRQKLEIYVLENSGEYERASESKLLPRFDVTLLERCLGMDSWLQARRAFRAALGRRTRSHER